MKHIMVGGVLEASEMALGCMRDCRIPFEDAEKLVLTAVDEGITFFDHADVYGAGASEEYFGRILERNPGLREKILIQSKCALIRDTEKTLYIDTSKKHIIESVENSMKRLKVDHLDTFLLHRADTLIEPEEVAEAFDILHSAGKVRYFGVSNFKTMDLAFLQSCLNQRLIINQMQLSVAHTELIDPTASVQLNELDNVDRNGGVLTYMRMKKMTAQAWSPFQVRFYGGVFMNDDQYPILNSVVNRMSEEKKASPSAIAIAWILRHPAKIQPLIGTTNKERLKDICTASNVEISREEWYELYRATLDDEKRAQVGNSNPKPAK